MAINTIILIFIPLQIVFLNLFINLAMPGQYTYLLASDLRSLLFGASSAPGWGKSTAVLRRRLRSGDQRDLR